MDINRNAIGFVVGLVVGFLLKGVLFPTPEPQVIKETVTVVERDTIVMRDTVTPPIPDPIIVEIPVAQPDGTVVTTPVNRYKGTQLFPGSGAKLTYEIDATELFRTHFDLLVPKVTETVTITNTERIILPAKSRLFFGGGLDFDWETKKPEAVNLGFMYNRRNKWMLGLGLTHDISGELPAMENLNLGARLYLGL